MPRDQIFISYSHKDQRWYDELYKNLKPFLRDGFFTAWSDQQIAPGSEWFKEIQSTLTQSKVALLLVTPDFIASDFIHEHELGPLLKEAEQGGVKILWIPVYESAYKQTALKNYQALLDPGKPLGGMTKAKRDQAWVKICEKIEKAVGPPLPEDSRRDAGTQSALSNIPDRQQQQTVRRDAPVTTTPTPAPLPSPVVTTKPAPSPTVAPARLALEDASKEHPWENSLGMKFVPIPGTKVFFSVWDTRVQDFEAFVADTNYDATGGMRSLGKDGWRQRGATWREPGFSQGPIHPVVGVSWNDAKKFCEWLTRREQGSGMLPRGRIYRLPTDAEWSAGVGLQGEGGNNPKRRIAISSSIRGARNGRRRRAQGIMPERNQIGEEPSDWPVMKGYKRRLSADESRGKFCGKRKWVV